MNNWIPIVEGCKMPNEGDDVLVTIWSDESYGKGTDIRHYVDIGSYRVSVFSYLETDIPGCGFDTTNDWDEGQPVKVIAWMPKPEPYVKGE